MSELQAAVTASRIKVKVMEELGEPVISALLRKLYLDMLLKFLVVSI